MLEALSLLIHSDKLADIEVIHTEILSPRREAVGFVDDKPYHMTRHQNLFHGIRPKHLRSNI